MKPTKSLILASSSPRRRNLLAGLGLDFMVLHPNIDETWRKNELPLEFAQRMALAKAKAIGENLNDLADKIVISADTIVVINEQRVLGKPRDAEEAKEMLRCLSENKHKVITAFCLLTDERDHCETVTTEVIFKSLTEQEITTYVASGDPLDKAGAYGIQNGANHMIKAIYGSYTNVMGLPLCELMDALSNFMR